jgi:hypothetical protein|tara:strand:- start:14676 stop:14870 length:195 start_codon:yes stop_codon:yes gene_type:complete
MYKLISIIFLAGLLSACAINEPRVSFGKKCVEKDNNVVYSYVWLYEKETGLNADEKTCEKIKKD